MDVILERLFALRDEKYAAFTAGLIPNISREKIIGVRAPLLRSLAKELISEGGTDDFLFSLPHGYHDENVLHAMIVASEKKDIESAFSQVELFLPYVDNWAVSDILVPKVFAKYPDKVLEKVKEWLGDAHTYTVRFALVVLLSNFLDEEFSPDMLELVSKIKTDEYYVNMAIAWYYSYALIKQYDAALPLFTQGRLQREVHNRSIQKACESFRVPDDRKNFLRSLRV